MIRKIKILLAVVTFFIGVIEPIHAQDQLDSIQELPDFVVVAKSFKEVIPVQKLSGKELKSLNSFSVADDYMQFTEAVHLSATKNETVTLPLPV